ncbi:MAG: glycosyltransferase family 4 protein [Erysipelotrichaceae bacterium]|nr:glycosyltransferase family 4 protein [Erysipelotrichaceae bacterium]
MKILMICQYYYPENFVISKIAAKLVSFGHQVDVLTGQPNYGYGEIIPAYKNIKEEVIDGVNVHRVKILPRKQSRISIIKNYLSFWKNSKKWVKKCPSEYDAVYSMSLSPVTILAAGNLYKKKHHVPHIVHCVDLWPESVLVTHAVRKHSLVYHFLYHWSKKLYSHVDEVLIGSPSFEKYFHDVLHLEDINIKYIPQPSFVEDNSSPAFDFDKDYLNVLYCGNLGRVQLINLIPEAMKELKDKKIRFHIIGMGPMSDILIKKINEYHLEESVIYYGPMPAMRASAYFQSADALYVSLEDSGFVGKTIPNKLIMSMAFAKPIIGMINGDGRKVINDADGGLICPQQSADALATTIESFKAISIDERKRLGNNNLAYYKMHFSLESVSRQIEVELMRKTR